MLLSSKKIKIGDSAIRVLVFLLVFAAMSIVNPTVASPVNLVNLLNNMVFISLSAMALTILMTMNILDLAVTAYGVLGAFSVEILQPILDGCQYVGDATGSLHIRRTEHYAFGLAHLPLQDRGFSSFHRNGQHPTYGFVLGRA